MILVCTVGGSGKLLSPCRLTEKRENQITMATVSKLALVLLLLLAEGKEPPTPAERVAALKKTCADKRVKLANWAKGKKLQTEARAQYLIGLHLAPNHKTIRSRMDHRKQKDGTWSRKKEKTFKDGKMIHITMWRALKSTSITQPPLGLQEFVKLKSADMRTAARSARMKAHTRNFHFLPRASTSLTEHSI